ncbi:MAG TPA: hypothetical protein VH988_09105 [Thermoanaerobaculia bacterium]|jgi:hypothetical protein|nr:hypothetical protein [Thermoanaerobaculia bacterium]
MKLTPWITAAALALGLSPAVQAQYRSYPPDQTYSYDSWNGDQAYALAHQVDQTSSWVYRQAVRNNRRPNREEARALAALYQLNSAASHFHGEVASYRRDPRHTANDFARLVSAYDNATEALRWIEPSPYIDRGMDRIADTLTQMSPFYGRTYDRYHGHGQDWDRHDRYDQQDRRDRYGRDGRDGRDRNGQYDRDPDHNGDGYRPPVR